MQTNSGLIDYLVNTRVLQDKRVEKAMRMVDRKSFVPKDLASLAYADEPLPIGEEQTISAPHMVAMMSQYIDARPGMKVLEIGAGSGYQIAVLAELVGNKGKVFGLEIKKGLAEIAKKRLKNKKNVKVRFGDGGKGWSEHAPFDRILISCAASHVPKELLGQLAEDGKLVVPIGGGLYQRLTLLEKKKGKIKATDLNCSCAFVPMLNA